MNKEFVTQRVAELLRLKKFDEWCWWFYNLVDDDTPDFHYSLERWTECPHLNSHHPDYSMSILSAPTVQAARDWLEEKYGFFIEIGRSIDLNGTYHYAYLILDKTCKYIYNQKDKDNDFPSSYDAANAALELCLENLI